MVTTLRKLLQEVIKDYRGKNEDLSDYAPLDYLRL